MKFIKYAALLAALLAPSMSYAQSVVANSSTIAGDPGSVPVTNTAGFKAKTPAMVPVRADGTVIDNSATGVAQASTTSGQLGELVQGATTTAAPTYTTAKTNPLSLTTAGALRVDGSGVTQTVQQAGNSFCHIATATTTTCKSGAGVLHTLSVNNLGTVASVTSVYDNTAGSGTVIAVINTLAGQTSYIYDIIFATGLTIVTTGTVAPDITVSYR